MRAWDPLSSNPYRLLGNPREQAPPHSSATALVLACPGLQEVKLSEELFQDCLARLRSEEVSYYRATWFDSTRPLDQMAWLDVCENRMLEALRRWSSESHLLSLHNLAVLAQLRWILEPDDHALGRECANRWRDLASLTQDPAYQQVVDTFRNWLKEQVTDCLQTGEGAQLREYWHLSVLLSSVEEVQAEQRTLLADDIERWHLKLAAARQALLNGAPVTEVTRQFEIELLPLAQFLQTATHDNLVLAAEFRQDLGLFYRQLARLWHDLPEASAKDYAEACLDKAIELVPEELRGEIRAELDHWRISRYPGQARPAKLTLIPGEEARAPRRRLGALISVVALSALVWAAYHQRDPMAGWTRPAVQHRADEISEEMKPLAIQLSQMPAQVERVRGPERQKLLDQQLNLHRLLETNIDLVRKY